MLVHAKNKKKLCEACEKIVSQKSNFKRHMLAHCKLKDHECDICKKKFIKY